MKLILEIAADLVLQEPGLETITEPQNKPVFLLHPLIGLNPIESIHRIHRDFTVDTLDTACRLNVKV